MKKCSVENCINNVHAKGMCKTHYLRWHRNGSTEKIDKKATAPRGKDLPQTKHGLWKHPLYATWHTMMARCNNPKNPKYARYGGRGISVCSRWHNVENFVKDLVNKPEGKSLDRIDNDGNYCPENVRWASPTEQARNRPQASIPQWKRDEAIKMYLSSGSPKLVAEALNMNASSVKNIVYLHKRLNSIT
jgi:hypothetical protein